MPWSSLVPISCPGDSICYQNGEKAAVKTGIRTSDWVEIISGLDGSRLIKQMKKP
jgi:hypothetical protein